MCHCGLEGMMIKDAAPILGLTVNAATKRWQRVREKLEHHPIITEFIEAT